MGGGEDSKERFCGLLLWLCPEGSGKGDYSDISKVCYLRCKKIIDSLTSGNDYLCQGNDRPPDISHLPNSLFS